MGTKDTPQKTVGKTKGMQHDAENPKQLSNGQLEKCRPGWEEKWFKGYQ